MLLQEFWTNRFWPHCTRNLRESTRVGYEHVGGGSRYRHREQNARTQRYQNHGPLLPQAGYRGVEGRATPLGESLDSLRGFPNPHRCHDPHQWQLRHRQWL